MSSSSKKFNSGDLVMVRDQILGQPATVRVGMYVGGREVIIPTKVPLLYLGHGVQKGLFGQDNTHYKFLHEGKLHLWYGRYPDEHFKLVFRTKNRKRSHG